MKSYHGSKPHVWDASLSSVLSRQLFKGRYNGVWKDNIGAKRIRVWSWGFVQISGDYMWVVVKSMVPFWVA